MAGAGRGNPGSAGSGGRHDGHVIPADNAHAAKVEEIDVVDNKGQETQKPYLEAPAEAFMSLPAANHQDKDENGHHQHAL